jgi:hypothetical protein
MFLAQTGGVGDDYIIYSSDNHNGLHMRTSWCEYACLSSCDTDVEKVVKTSSKQRCRYADGNSSA